MTEWIAFEQINGPLGPSRGDHHAALIASVIANSNRGKGSRRYKLDDFLLKWDQSVRRKEPQTPDEMLRRVKNLNKAFGGVDLTEGR